MTRSNLQGRRQLEKWQVYTTRNEAADHMISNCFLMVVSTNYVTYRQMLNTILSPIALLLSFSERTPNSHEVINWSPSADTNCDRQCEMMRLDFFCPVVWMTLMRCIRSSVQAVAIFFLRNKLSCIFCIGSSLTTFKFKFLGPSTRFYYGLQICERATGWS